jgi:2-hydroxychromene-2-carboxylate isomerase
MIPKVEFHFDFGSPNAYFAHKLIPEIEKRTGATFHYVPVLLGGVFKLTNNQAPMVQFKGIKNKLEYQRLETQRFISKHGLSQFKMNPHFPINTVQIMRGAVAAQMDGRLAAYVDAVFRHMWEEGRKMDDAEVIRVALDAAGLDGVRTLERIQDQAVKDLLLKTTEGSVARGTFGSPTFFVGEEIFFGKDRLGDVEEAIEAAKAAGT